VRQRLGGNADAVVADVEYRIGALALDAQGDAPAARGVLDGVVEQIHDHLLEARPVALHRHPARSCAGDTQLLVLGEQTHLIGGGAGQLRQVKAHPFGRGFTGIQARQREQTLDDLGEARDLLEHAAEGLTGLTLQPLILRQALKLPAHDGERRAQLVRGVRDELLGAVDRILEARDHVIERHREALELIAAAHHRQPLAQVVLGDLLGLAGDARHRIQRPSHQHEAAGDRHAHRNRQTYGQHEEYLRESRLGGRAGGADFHPITRAIARRGVAGGDQQRRPRHGHLASDARRRRRHLLRREARIARGA
jgi:hypothetical protein